MPEFRFPISDDFSLNCIIQWGPTSPFGCHTYGVTNVCLGQVMVERNNQQVPLAGKTVLELFCEQEGIPHNRYFSRLSSNSIYSYLYNSNFTSDWKRSGEVRKKLAEEAGKCCYEYLLGKYSGSYAYLFMSDHLFGGMTGDMDIDISTKAMALRMIKDHGAQGIAAPLIINPNHYLPGNPHVDQAWVFVRTVANKPHSVAWDTASVFNVAPDDPNTLENMKVMLRNQYSKGFWKSTPNKFLKHYKNIFSWASDE